MAPSTIAELFTKLDQTSYGEAVVHLNSDGKDVYVISDLHLAGGCNANNNYDGTENFFADQALSRFIKYLIVNSGNSKSILVINGDFVDFIRITNLPGQLDLLPWQQMLQDLRINKSTAELAGSISKKEIQYGLKTHDYKSVWKLMASAKGHCEVFQSLALWLQKGNELVIVKGNHDIEWYWNTVRNCLRLLLAQHIATLEGCGILTAIEKHFDLVSFADSSLIIDQRTYIEHGHLYERFTAIDGLQVLHGTDELNLPFGSFFNRYLINCIELAYPHIDDVRPRQKILPLLLRERFPLAVKLLFCYVPFAFMVIPKKQYKYALKYLFQFLLIIVLPVAVTVIAFYKDIFHPSQASASGGLLQSVLSSLKNLAFLALSYFIGRLQSMLQLSAPDGLYKNAVDVFDKLPQVQFVIFGHTHNPAQINYNSSKKYYNTGTWMPVFETSAAEVRSDKVFSFLLVPYNSIGNELPRLMRWNDDALRTEPLTLIERK